MNVASELRVMALPASTVRRDGWVGPAHPRAESDWLPVVGPACFVLWRQLAGGLVEAHGTMKLRARDLAASVGMAPAVGSQSGLTRSLRRLQRFGIIWRPVDDLVIVRCQLPLLDESRMQTLRPIIRRMQHELHETGSPGETGTTS
ncbi:MAG: hypothetical protein ACRD2C_16225 [Acidimicrobiales bacterium]